jgi:hypothetical protein
MKHSIILCGIVILPLAFGCEDEDCEKVTSVTPVFYEAMEYPESFDTYVANNQAVFDANFFRCLDQKLIETQKVIDRETAECDELYGGSDLWVGCYNDNILGPENLLSILYTIKRVTKGEVRWADTNTGLSIIVMKSSDPETWQQMIEVFRQAELEADCMFCETQRCFLGICW